MSIKSFRPFEDALADLRVSGSVLLFESYRPPWAIVVPGEDELRSLLGVSKETRVLPFHLVLEGAFVLTPKNSAPETISAHEVVICTRGDEHLMSVGRVRKPTPFAAIHMGDRPGAAAVDSAVAPTKLLCGVVLMNSAPLNPLLGSLPAVVILALTSRKGAGCLAPPSITQILPVFSTTNSRPLPSPACVRKTGSSKPS